MDYWSPASFDYAVDTKTIPGFMVSESNKSLMVRDPLGDIIDAQWRFE